MLEANQKNNESNSSAPAAPAVGRLLGNIFSRLKALTSRTPEQKAMIVRRSFAGMWRPEMKRTESLKDWRAIQSSEFRIEWVRELHDLCDTLLKEGKKLNGDTGLVLCDTIWPLLCQFEPDDKEWKWAQDTFRQIVPARFETEFPKSPPLSQLLNLSSEEFDQASGEGKQITSILRPGIRIRDREANSVASRKAHVMADMQKT